MKIRAHECRNCAHLWTSSVRLSKNAVGISGEAAAYCPRCNSRDVNSGPQQELSGVLESDWEWFGKSGHFIGGNDCRFHLATKIGDFLVSTIGEYLPDEPIREILASSRGIVLKGKGDARLSDYMKKCGYEEIGLGRKYETMVFRVKGVCTCGCGQPNIVPRELLFDRYNDAEAARQGHMALCRKVASGWQPEEGEGEW